jgi:putative membrane protein
MKISMITTGLSAGLVAAGLMISLAGASAAQGGMDRMFATKAAQGGMAEVMDSQLALNKSHNSRVRAVAKRMVREHTAANDELKAVAQRKRMALPKQTDPMHKMAHARLARLSGKSFDRAYIAGQEKDHAATVRLFQREIALGKDKDLSSFAAKNLPAIQDHTRMIFQVGSGLGVHAVPMPPLKSGLMPSSMSGQNM